MCVYCLRLLSIFLASTCFKFQSFSSCFWSPQKSPFSGFQVWSLTRYNTSQNFLLKKFLKENSVSRNLSTRILRRTGKLGGDLERGVNLNRNLLKACISPYIYQTKRIEANPVPVYIVEIYVVMLISPLLMRFL